THAEAGEPDARRVDLERLHEFFGERVDLEWIPEQMRRLRRDQDERELAARGRELRRSVAIQLREVVTDFARSVQEDQERPFLVGALVTVGQPLRVLPLGV